MEDQNYSISLSDDELRQIGINNLPQFFQTSKQMLTNAIASIAVIESDNLQGEEDRLIQITHLQQLQTFIRLLEQKEDNL